MARETQIYLGGPATHADHGTGRVVGFSHEYRGMPATVDVEFDNGRRRCVLATELSEYTVAAENAAGGVTVIAQVSRKELI